MGQVYIGLIDTERTLAFILSMMRSHWWGFGGGKIPSDMFEQSHSGLVLILGYSWRWDGVGRPKEGA